jgi:ABC-type polysaccharide/polyol phosphate export permease
MVEPAKTIATVNPLSFIAEGVRRPIIGGESAGDVAAALAAIAGIGLIALWLARGALRHRLRTGG